MHPLTQLPGLVTLDGNTISTLTDFAAFSTEIVSAIPTGINSASYTATNSPAACPTVDSTWVAASNLPPTPNAELCSCVVPTLTCVLSNSTSSNDYGNLFSTVCGYGACGGVEANYTTGVYGAYSMCDSEQQLSFAFNQYYEAQVKAGNSASACNFGGAATSQAAVSATGTCASLLQQAGTAGTGSVSGAVATGTSGAKKSSASGPRFAGANSMSVGLGQAAVFILTALFTGAGTGTALL